MVLQHLATTAPDVEDDRTVGDAAHDERGLAAGKVVRGDVDDLAGEVEVLGHARPRRPNRHLKNIRNDGKNSLTKLIFLPSSKPRAT